MSVIAAACLFLFEAVVVAASTDVPCTVAGAVVAAPADSPAADAADTTTLLLYALSRGCAIGAVAASVAAAAARIVSSYIATMVY